MAGHWKGLPCHEGDLSNEKAQVKLLEGATGLLDTA